MEVWKGAPSTPLTSVAVTRCVAAVLERAGLPGAVSTLCQVVILHFFKYLSIIIINNLLIKFFPTFNYNAMQIYVLCKINNFLLWHVHWTRFYFCKKNTSSLSIELVVLYNYFYYRVSLLSCSTWFLVFLTP